MVVVISIVALLVGAFMLIFWLEGVDDKRKQDRLEEWYRDEFDSWNNETDV